MLLIAYALNLGNKNKPEVIETYNQTNKMIRHAKNYYYENLKTTDTP